MPRLPAEERADLKELVLVACHKILAAGHVPSQRQLGKYFPTRGKCLLVNLRDELRFAGRLKWDPSEERSKAGIARHASASSRRGNPAGRKDWEQRVWLQCRFRAKKIEKGEPPRTS